MGGKCLLSLRVIPGTQKARRGVRGTRVGSNRQYPLGELVGYHGIQEQLKEPEVIKSMFISFDNSR